jgi:hypothetical protein
VITVVEYILLVLITWTLYWNSNTIHKTDTITDQWFPFAYNIRIFLSF